MLAVSDDVKKFAPDIQKVRLATAASLADLVFQFGYKLEEGGVEMDENEQGSGMQSLLMFETLHLIDRDYFQQFGWKQAAVWAVEEPESSLNTALEARTAHFLSRVAKERGGRLQIIGTTHSDLMIQYGGNGYYIEKSPTPNKGVESTASAMTPTRDRSAMDAAAANREMWALMCDGVKVMVPDREGQAGTDQPFWVCQGDRWGIDHAR